MHIRGTLSTKSHTLAKYITSEPGKGTTFKLYFPRVADPLNNSAAGEADPPKAFSGETILVVEDEQAVRQLTVRMLERIGYQVLTAATGAEAVELSQAHPGYIALLLTDVVMPSMSGKSWRTPCLRPGLE